MDKRIYLFGNRNEVGGVGGQRPEPQSVRLLTRLHLASAPTVERGFALAAQMCDGREVIVRLADSRAEALANAGAAAADAPEGAKRLALCRWLGGPQRGHWAPVRCTPGELPRLPRREHRRRGI